MRCETRVETSFLIQSFREKAEIEQAKIAAQREAEQQAKIAAQREAERQAKLAAQGEAERQAKEQQARQVGFMSN